MKQKPAGYSWQESNCQQKTAMSKYWLKWLFKALQLLVEQLMLCTSTINKHLQKYSRTQNLQNIQQTKLQNQIPNIPNGMYIMQKQYTGKSETIFNLRLKIHQKDVNIQNSKLTNTFN